MSDFHFEATRPTARRRHVCAMCRRIIEIGETYFRQGGFFDGRGYTVKTCRQCEEFASALHRAGFENEEGGWPWIEELTYGEVAVCGYGAKMTLFHARWLRNDGSLFEWPADAENGEQQ